MSICCHWDQCLGSYSCSTDAPAVASARGCERHMRPMHRHARSVVGESVDCLGDRPNMLDGVTGASKTTAIGTDVACSDAPIGLCTGCHMLESK